MVSKKEDDRRAELNELKKKLESSNDCNDKEVPEADSVEDGKDDKSTQDLSAQFNEVIEGFSRDLQEANPMTLLVVFALGVLMGRMLSK
jgi:hypothetical protein